MEIVLPLILPYATQYYLRVFHIIVQSLFTWLNRMREKEAGLKFCNMWVYSPDFMSITRQQWNPVVPRTPMYQVITNLTRLKLHLKQLHQNKLGEVHQRPHIA